MSARLDELVAAAGGDPLAAALDIVEQLRGEGREQEANQLLRESILPALEDRRRQAEARSTS